MRRCAISPVTLGTPARWTALRLAARRCPRGQRDRHTGRWRSSMNLSNVDRGHLAELCRRYGVARIDVFGSVARGEDGCRAGNHTDDGDHHRASMQTGSGATPCWGTSPSWVKPRARCRSRHEPHSRKSSGGNRRGCATGSCTATGPSMSTSCTRLRPSCCPHSSTHFARC